MTTTMISAPAPQRGSDCNTAGLGKEGTGNTLVGRWHAEASEARRVLVPSLALL